MKNKNNQNFQNFKNYIFLLFNENIVWKNKHFLILNFGKYD